MWKLILQIFKGIPGKALPSPFERRRINKWVYAIVATILMIVVQLEDPNVERAVIRDLSNLCPKTTKPSNIYVPELP